MAQFVSYLPPQKNSNYKNLKISCQNTFDYLTLWPTILNVIPIWYLIQSRKQDPFITGIQYSLHSVKSSGYHRRLMR